MKALVLLLAMSVAGCCSGLDTHTCDPMPKYKGYGLQFQGDKP